MKRAMASTFRNVAFVCVALLASGAWGQTASLVRDINTQARQPASSFPGQMLAVGDKLFFVAFQEGSGRELWVSDGSGTGTQMLGDLCPGNCEANISLPGSTGGVVLFRVSNSIFQGRQATWRSDGTRKGTFELRSAQSEPLLTYDPEEHADPGAVSVAGVLLFPACTPDSKCYLWRSNGTSEGTQPLAEFTFFGLAAAGGKAYFLTDAGDLWTSDGTAAGTRKVHDFPNLPFLLTPAGNRVFFFAADGQGYELWTSDGTAAGTRALTNFRDGQPFFSTQGVRVFGNHIYFLADDGIHGIEIWRSDGTVKTTRRVTELSFEAPFESGFISSQMEEVGNRLLFAAKDGPNATRKLWTTSGDPRSTAPLPCAGGCPELPQFNSMVKVGERALFIGSDDAHGRELWSSDGTPAGTALIKDFCPGPCDGLPVSAQMVPFSGTAFLTPTVGSSRELWTSDGTAAGTRRFADPATGFQPLADRLLEIAALGLTRFFPGQNGYGAELWASDGNPGGTRLVTDLARDEPGSDPQDLVALADRLFFTACDGNNRNVWKSSGAPETTLPATDSINQCDSLKRPHNLTVAGPWVYYLFEEGTLSTLWRTDGTTAGTLHLANLRSLAPDLVAFGNRIVFSQPAGGSFNWEMWQSDGTLEGTKKLFDLPADAGRPRFLTAVGSELYFAGEPDFGHSELWRSDGTLAGTRRLTEGLNLAAPPHFTRLGSDVYFATGFRSVSSPALWKTDGTSGGTKLVRAFLGSVDDLSGLMAFHGALYFFFSDIFSPSLSTALWRSDGTEAGTVPVMTFLGEFEFGDPLGLTLFNDHLYFAADDSVHGRELWTSDGTTAGTTLVRDLYPGPLGSQPTGITVAGGRLFFSAGDPDHGIEPWVSDGTAAGTRLLQDLAPEGASSYPAFFTVAGGQLYFSADDRLYGSELWSLPLAGSGGCQPSSTNLCLNGGRFKVEAQWRDFQGNTGAGQAVALTADTGYFWFFDPANVEVILKVLDGRALNDHFWVYFGALSNVEYTLTVTDTMTGATHRYFNPSGSFGSVGDTHGFGPLGAFFSADQSPANPAKTLLPLVAERTQAAAATGVCVPGAGRLCLNGGRFAVEAAWKDFAGQTGTGTAVPLSTDTGYFWFFGASNVEVVLKVLDGQAFNGHFWVFYGALSNVEYTLTVTDTMTGHIRTYRNPSGQFASIGDTEAF